MELRGNIAGRGFAAIRIESDRIGAVVVEGVEREGEPFYAPALTDIQLNGFAGVDFAADGLEPEQLISVLPSVWRTGTGAFCPTLISNHRECLLRNLRTLEAARRADVRFARSVPCYHLEGPFLSPGPSHGAHDPARMRLPDWDEFRQLQDAAEGRIGILTIAPELPGAPGFIEKAAASGVVVSVGHTDGKAADVHRAASAGARLATHLGNGCPQLIHRHENPIWAQMVSGALAASIICDTFHLPPDLVRVIVQMKREKTILITDATHVAGLAPGRYWLVGTEIELQPNGKVVCVENDCLGGSAVTMDRAVGVFAEYTGVPLEAALHAATTAPARLLGRGVPARIAAGEPASLIRFRPAPGRLRIEELWLAGERVYAAA